jgi:hypothetical protein
MHENIYYAKFMGFFSILYGHVLFWGIFSGAFWQMAGCSDEKYIKNGALIHKTDYLRGDKGR